MITAVDSSVMLDVFRADEVHGKRSRRALEASRLAGAIVACDIVWAEVLAWFRSGGADAMSRLQVTFDPMRAEAAALAGNAWRRYRDAGGPRQRLVADFLIGAHAVTQADRLLTRDRGFYRRYFTDLTVLEPGQLDG